MATITAKSLITIAQTLLQDATSVRWPRAELLGYLNDGQRETVLLKPEACVTNAAALLTADETMQSLPADGISLIAVPRNMGVSGSTPGRAIRIVSREVLDAQSPDWHTMVNSAGLIQHYMYDPLDPKHYFVYPKAPVSGWYVQLVYSSAPTDAEDDDAKTIGIDDIYANALVDYVLYRAYSKDAQYAQNASLAAAHYGVFANSLGVKTANDQSRNPNLSATPFNPNVPGSAKV